MKKRIIKILDNYANKDCQNCGRHRVERYVLEDNSIVHICEKCHWCEESHQYELGENFWGPTIDDEIEILDNEYK